MSSQQESTDLPIKGKSMDRESVSFKGEMELPSKTSDGAAASSEQASQKASRKVIAPVNFDMGTTIPWMGCCCCIGTFSDCFPLSSQCEVCGLGWNAQCCGCMSILLDCCPHVDQWCGLDECSCFNCKGGKCCGCSCDTGRCCNIGCNEGQCCNSCFSCWCLRVRLVVESTAKASDETGHEEEVRSPSISISGASAPRVQLTGPALPKFEGPKVKGHCMKFSCCPWLADVVFGCDSNQECCGFNAWACECGCPFSALCNGACSAMKIKMLLGTSVPCLFNICGCNICFRYRRATGCCVDLSTLGSTAGFVPSKENSL